MTRIFRLFCLGIVLFAIAALACAALGGPGWLIVLFCSAALSAIGLLLAFVEFAVTAPLDAAEASRRAARDEAWHGDMMGEVAFPPAALIDVIHSSPSEHRVVLRSGRLSVDLSPNRNCFT